MLPRLLTGLCVMSRLATELSSPPVVCSLTASFGSAMIGVGEVGCSVLALFPGRSLPPPELRRFRRPHALQTRLVPWRRQTGVLSVPHKLQLCKKRAHPISFAGTTSIKRLRQA